MLPATWSNIQWTHEVFSNWDYDQFHNASVEFTDTTTYPPPLPFEDQYETELVDVQVSFRVDANGVAIPLATAYVIVKSINESTPSATTMITRSANKC